MSGTSIPSRLTMVVRSGLLVFLSLAFLFTAFSNPHLNVALWRNTLVLSVLCSVWWWLRERRLPRLLPSLYATLYLLVSLTITTHALASVQALPTFLPIHAQPDLSPLFLSIHYGLTIWLILSNLLPPAFHLPAVWPAVFLYSSYVYFRTFHSIELGALYSALFALILGYVLLRPKPLLCALRRSLSTGSLVYALVAFTLLLGLGAALSPDPGESLEHWLPVVFFGFLPFVLAGDTIDMRTWYRMAGWVVLLGGGLFAVLAAIKFAMLLVSLGLLPALRYRLFIADTGPNWIARSLVTLLPLTLCLALVALGRWSRLLWIVCALAMFLTLAYTQSISGFSGWMALLLGAGSLGLLLKWPVLRARWAGCCLRRGLPLRTLLLAVLGILILAAAALIGSWLACRTNPFSFSGRLYIWRTALNQVADHYLLGSGLGVRYLASAYGAGVVWEEMGPRVQFFLDAPLSHLWQKRQTGVHAHNLALELALGAGLPALLAFLWYLWELARDSLGRLRHASGKARVLIAGVIAGLVATLAWGFLDVMEFSPPFFTFPTWVLVGLLLSAPQSYGMEDGQPMEGRLRPFLGKRSWPGFCSLRFAIVVVCSGAALGAILMPLIGNMHYRKAYTAYQERRWETATIELIQAARWQPFSAKVQQLRAEALINLGRYDQAFSAYERALRLKRGFAPYHSQLGWLHWLRGDMEAATEHFQWAVALDPREVWRDGLHADLGLAYASQGRADEAITFFKETIELDPQMAHAPYWVQVLEVDGTYNLALDLVYLGGPSPALDRRILSHLGRADYAPRLFAPSQVPVSLPVPSFDQVMDAMEEDYSAAHVAGSREAPRLLATLAEAARLTGSDHRAERAYLEYQRAYPESAYGFRDLGALHRKQGRLPEARQVLELGLSVSPRDVASWYELTEVYLDRGLWPEAESALNTIYRLAPLDSRLYGLQARLYQDQGELAAAGGSLHKSLFIEDEVSQYLRLAQLYSEQGYDERAIGQCSEAAAALLRTAPRPLAPELWDTGLCIARSGATTPPPATVSLARDHPLAGNILLGHIYRAQGQLDLALAAYQRAATARPDEGGPHYFLGETYRALGQMQTAEAEYRQAAELDPLESLPLLVLGRLQWSLGQAQAALESYRAAVEVNPGWGPAHVALGNALLALGNQDGAAEHYRLAQAASGDLQEGQIYDFAVHLAEADIRSPSPDHVRHDYLAIDGDARRALFMHPDSSVRYTVQVPEGAHLAFDVATASETWEQPGDGVTFTISIEPAEHPASDSSVSSPPLLFSTYIDPKHDPSARRWHPHSIDLGTYAGQVVTLTFETSAGPAGDDRYDWAGWSLPRLFRP